MGERGVLANERKPLLMAMILERTPEEAIAAIRDAVSGGAEAIGIEMAYMERCFRTSETYRELFYFTQRKPVYFTNYRDQRNTGMADDILAEELLEIGKAMKGDGPVSMSSKEKTGDRCEGKWGGTVLCDVMGDLYDPSPLQMTGKREAVIRQKELIERLHAQGTRVLMSCHTGCFLERGKVTEIMMEQARRGVDVAKIVTRADTEDELWQNLETMQQLRKELPIPFLFLANGRYCKKQRTLGSLLFSPFVLCVPRYTVLSSKEQPALEDMRQVTVHLEWEPFGAMKTAGNGAADEASK